MSALSKDEIARYARQIVLREVGGPGQHALKNAKVLIIGAGGLGGPAGLYLAAAGAGTVGIVDFDSVDISNLHRQIQFTDTDLETPKTKAMAARLRAANPHIQIQEHNITLHAGNADALIKQYDLILDGTDSFAARFAVNEACLATKTPLISGALGRFDGQVAVFSGDGEGPCYRCLVPQTPPDIETCAQVGVVGALAGIIGSMMALEAVKWITGAGKPLTGRLFIYDGLNGTSRTAALSRDPDCPSCTAR